MFTIRHTKESSPLKNFANCLSTMQNYYIKFYTLVVHSIRCKSGKFYYIMYRIDKTMLLLLMATWLYQEMTRTLPFKASA